MLFHYKWEVERVVDWDTIDIVFDLGFSIMRKERVRVARIDTPEITGSKAKDPKEKKAGLESKAYLEDLLERKWRTLFIHTEKLKKGRYNRIIWDLFFEDWENLSDSLVEAGHAKYVKY